MRQYCSCSNSRPTRVHIGETRLVALYSGSPGVRFPRMSQGAVADTQQLLSVVDGLPSPCDLLGASNEATGTLCAVAAASSRTKHGRSLSSAICDATGVITSLIRLVNSAGHWRADDQ